MLKLTTDKHEASRGLSATVELLVKSVLMLYAKKLSKLIHACRNYSSPNLARFLETQCTLNCLESSDNYFFYTVVNYFS